MELDELEIGDPRTGPQRRRHSVAGRDGRVRRRGVDLAQTPGRQHHSRGVCRAHAVDLSLTDDVEGGPGDPVLLVGKEVDDERMLDDLDPGVVDDPPQRLDEGARDLLAGRVTSGVRDPVAVVPALAGQFDLAIVGAIELRTEGDQFAHPLGTFGHEDPHSLDITQADPGDQGVLEVLLRRVLGIECSGDTTLGPRGGPLVENRLGHEQDPPDVLAQLQGAGEAGDARSDDDDVGGRRPAGGRRGEAAGDANGSRRHTGPQWSWRRCVTADVFKPYPSGTSPASCPTSMTLLERSTKTTCGSNSSASSGVICA